MVVGGGAAGLMAALAAARLGAHVHVCEQLQRPGVRLLASGGGRGNLTHTLAVEAMMARFGRRGRFMQPALAALDPEGLRRLLAELGVPTFSPDGFHVYPSSESAADVQQALVRACDAAGVVFHLACPARSLVLEGQVMQGVETAGGLLPARRMILATGGRSYPRLGGGDQGYALARQVGHTITPLLPALAPLVTREPWPASCSGAALPDAELSLAQEGRSAPSARGALLFTHRGFSGPAALDLSGDASARLQAGAPVSAFLNLTPGRRTSDWLREIGLWPRSGGRKTIARWLDDILPRSVAAALAGACALPDTLTASHVTQEQRQRLAEHLAAWPVTITGTGGFEAAMVTRGGVTLDEIDPRRLASRLVQGLYFAGEIVDLDGPCGGFNLQWAFSSGWLAGRSAAAP